MNRRLDLKTVDRALKRAARRAAHAPPDERAGRFLVSSVIKSVEYDEDAHELDVKFITGKTYRYREVPPEVYERLLDADSKGKFFNERIRDSFEFHELVGRPY